MFEPLFEAPFVYLSVPTCMILSLVLPVLIPIKIIVPLGDWVYSGRAKRWLKSRPSAIWTGVQARVRSRDTEELTSSH